VSELHQVEALTAKWPKKLLAAEEAASGIGIPAARLLELANAHMAPHYRIDHGEPLFLGDELKLWAATNLLEHFEGTKVPAVQVIAVELPPPARRPPAALTSLRGLREIPVASLTGIYFLCEGDEVVYVGQSTALFARIASHRSERRKAFSQVFFLPVLESELDNVEAAFIAALEPRMNGRHPRGGQPMLPVKNWDTTKTMAVLKEYADDESSGHHLSTVRE